MQHVVLEQRKLPYRLNEELKLLRTNLLFCGDDKRKILITSTLDNEGKSSISLQLSLSLAELGKTVLLIDADLRKSVMKHNIEEGSIKFGLTHYLSGQCGLEDAVCETDSPGLSMLFAGAVAPNPTELLANSRMENLMGAASDHYDYVIVDCPPLGIVVDAAVVAPFCDGSVLVVSAGEIKYRMAQEVTTKLRNTQIPILGVVLNKVDMSKNSKYFSKNYGRYRYYNKRYNNYYGSLSDGELDAKAD